jgi:Putative zinc-finger
MDCKFTERSLSEYLEGELTATQALELEEHLNACGSCSQLLDEYRRIVSACRALPDYEARQELWIPIKRQLRQGPVSAVPVSTVRNAAEPLATLLGRMVFYRRVAYVSISIALLSFSVWIGQFLYPSDRGLMPDSETAELAVLEVRKAEIHYRNAIESLTQVLETSKGQWSPELRQVVEQNLRTIDASIADCRLAIRREPQNLEAKTYLLAAYRKKFELLKTLLDNPAIAS